MAMTDDTVKIARLKERYEALLHAVQSGVKWELEAEQFAGIPEQSSTGSPKHLRVGVNSALVQNSSLAILLMRKGVITELEYWETQIELWEAEVASYEQKASQAAGGVRVKFQ